MSFYESLGFLVFGSRLRRLSEAFLADVNKIYASHELSFDAAWFPVFYILSRQETVSIKDISGELGISHSAVSQLLSSLQQKGLTKTSTASDDARKKVVAFTAKGKKLQQQVQPVWDALQQAMEELVQEGKHSRNILTAIGEIEQGLQNESVFNRVQHVLHQQ
ncbi:MarR family winged helix-turn-helix transcriptional regulator [Niastella populi]|uniref:MarR family transcriptional regulator n=1 Tax=Niastella populi TaxID=550983 RepID=A0A1V9FPL4_9BACT|nr:MarR family winged helix-turn-helix transcriptional regulator [Niastella populi]OQP60304.1 MarR family transcriptional regulator [Niastella populi]